MAPSADGGYGRQVCPDLFHLADCGAGGDCRGHLLALHRASQIPRGGGGCDDADRTRATPEWTPRRALGALRYHLKLLTLILDKLDLPFAQLHELHLSRKRRRQIPCIGSSNARAGEKDLVSRRRWRSTPAGSIFLMVEPCCSLWRMNDAAAIGVEKRGPRREAFGCLTSEEASLVAEAEAHICAALRHFARMPPAPTECSTTASGCTASGDEHKDELLEENHAEMLGDATMPKLPLAACSPDVKEPTKAADTRLSLEFASALTELQDVAWAFCLREKLIEALIQGDPLLVAAWALRCLGVNVPWSLKRLQDFAVQALEIVAEDSAINSAGADGAKPKSSHLESLRFFCEACALYLRAPIIPRYRGRLAKVASNLSILKLAECMPSDDGRNVNETFQAAASALATAAGVGSASGSATASFDGGSEALQKLRLSDSICNSFRESIMSSVFDHLRSEDASTSSSCEFDAASIVVSGAEALVQLHSGHGWPPERSRQFLDSIACVQGPALSTALEQCLGGPDSSDLREFDDHSLGLEDVSLDMIVAKMSSPRSAGNLNLCCSLRQNLPTTAPA